MGAIEECTLYEALAQRAHPLVGSVPAAFPTLCQPTDANRQYYQTLYLDQLNSASPRTRPGDETCRECERFHLTTRKQIDKSSDITLGNRLEACFQEFLQEQLDTTYGLRVDVVRADTLDLHMPDFKIVDRDTEQALAYFEFKVIFRPYLKIRTMVNSAYECYANSLTLDLSSGTATGAKLQEQRDRVESRLGTANVDYIYWYDIPCIKGVFWMPADRVYQLMDTQIPYSRRVVAGDYDAFGTKRGSTNKIYLPLLEMRPLSSYLDKVEALTKRARED